MEMNTKIKMEVVERLYFKIRMAKEGLFKILGQTKEKKVKSLVYEIFRRMDGKH